MADGSRTYLERRGWLENYFDRTAADAWAKLTSDGPVSRIRATVRAGRDRMRETLLASLPADLSGQRLLDAGCGTGALSVEAAKRGAQVVAIDLSPTLVDLARERTDELIGAGKVSYRVGDMLDPSLGEFDHVVAMDSFIHYDAADLQGILESLAPRCRRTLSFTFAPRTFLLSLMHTAGKVFPRGNRAPRIVPISERGLRRRIGASAGFAHWSVADTTRIKSGFYISQSMTLRREEGA
ncbi:MAG: magnesium protoporphyrin IX methyltransferase [Myxococcota bacterium]